MMDNMGGEIFKPKISLRAPLMLSNNLEAMQGRYTVTPRSGMLQFEPSTPYGEITPSAEPIRQRFSLTLPPKRASTQEERDQWRSVLGWCEECEQTFLQSPAKPNAESVTFHPWPDGRYLVEVDCGIAGNNKVRMFFTYGEINKMPSTGVHVFEQGYYVDDPRAELRKGAQRLINESSDLLVGKISYDKKTRLLTVERSTAKESYEFQQGYPQRIKGSYKDRAGKWITLDSLYQNSMAMESETCASSALKSNELATDRASTGWQNEGN
jgi:hypothetical protein